MTKPIQIYTKTHQIAPFKFFSSGGMPPNPPKKMGRFAPRNTSRKQNVYFSTILSPPCLNMDVRPCYQTLNMARGCRTVND